MLESQAETLERKKKLRELLGSAKNGLYVKDVPLEVRINAMGTHNLHVYGLFQFISPIYWGLKTFIFSWFVGVQGWLVNGLFHLLIKFLNGVYWGYNPFTNLLAVADLPSAWRIIPGLVIG